tara:strand:+ start:410 stop:754 length:345 start_codon:yes stop_codon:yes gene_type:complete
MISLIAAEVIQEGTSKGIDINNYYLFAVKQEGQIYLYWNRCPHLGTPLEWQEDKFLDAEGALIQCSTHGALFRIEDGYCLVGPCKGKKLQRIPFIIENGMIMIEHEQLASPPRH